MLIHSSVKLLKRMIILPIFITIIPSQECYFILLSIYWTCVTKHIYQIPPWFYWKHPHWFFWMKENCWKTFKKLYIKFNFDDQTAWGNSLVNSMYHLILSIYKKKSIKEIYSWYVGSEISCYIQFNLYDTNGFHSNQLFWNFLGV